MARAPQTWTGVHTERRSRVERRRKVARGEHWTGHEPASTRYWIETAEGTLSIDIDTLFKHLASKAMRSSRGTSKMLDGAVKLKITKRTEVEVRIEERPLSEGTREVAA